MKRKIAITLITALMLGLTACGGTNESNNAESPSVQEETAQSAENNDQTSSDSETDSEANTGSGGTGNRILIAYFAVAENSDVDAVSSASVAEVDGEAKVLLRIVAEDIQSVNIQSVTGGDLFSIQTSVDYPGDIDE